MTSSLSSSSFSYTLLIVFNSNYPITDLDMLLYILHRGCFYRYHNDRSNLLIDNGSNFLIHCMSACLNVNKWKFQMKFQNKWKKYMKVYAAYIWQTTPSKCFKCTRIIRSLPNRKHWNDNIFPSLNEDSNTMQHIQMLPSIRILILTFKHSNLRLSDDSMHVFFFSFTPRAAVA